jgi:DNA/RNA-binding domain of Phe-tRNA-synthetase-like protein
MIELAIHADLESKVPAVAVGWITATVQVTEHDEGLWREIEAAAGRFRGMTMEQARKFPPIKALRDAYRALGNDPTRYRGSSEALVRRIVQGKELYRVNTVVDINNLISLETLHSAGTFNLDHLRPPIVFRIGRPDERYSGIGRGEIKIEGLPVFADQLGSFGSTTSDSQRAMIRLETTRIMMVIISFLGSEGMEAALQRAVGLLERYVAAREGEVGVVE